MITASLTSESPVSPMSLLSSGSSSSPPISPLTPATSFANSDLPGAQTAMERISDISALLRIQEQDTAELNLRVVALTQRVERLRRKLNDVSGSPFAPASLRTSTASAGTVAPFSAMASTSTAASVRTTGSAMTTVSHKADVLYSPEIGLPVTIGRCQRLRSQLGIARLETTGSASPSSRSQWRMCY